ncbi:MAG: hypothetical protein K6E59_02040 [Bacilli bacterium]|nr:hypothetical protein [Bacilli bacterium]
MKPSLLLPDAKAAHDTLVRELTAVFNQLDPLLKAERFDDDPQRLIVPFDLMLQFDLLNLALEAQDKQGCIQFLKGMATFHYDLIAYANEYATVREVSPEFSWDRFLWMSEGDIGRSLAIISAGVEPLWEDALAAMSKADLSIEKDLYQIFEDNIYRIADCFLMVDDRSTDTDVRKAIERIRTHMMIPIVRSNDELFKRVDPTKK